MAFGGLLGLLAGGTYVACKETKKHAKYKQWDNNVKKKQDYALEMRRVYEEDVKTWRSEVVDCEKEQMMIALDRKIHSTQGTEHTFAGLDKWKLMKPILEQFSPRCDAWVRYDDELSRRAFLGSHGAVAYADLLCSGFTVDKQILYQHGKDVVELYTYIEKEVQKSHPDISAVYVPNGRADQWYQNAFDISTMREITEPGKIVWCKTDYCQLFRRAMDNVKAHKNY